MNRDRLIGTIAGVFTITIWASTYIFTKIVSAQYSAIQISFIRFSIGWVMVLLISPKRRTAISLRDELRFAGIGVLGIFLYYLLENLATANTYASNVSVIVTSIPLITSMLAPLFFPSERFRSRYVWTFGLAISGFLIILSRNGAETGVSLSGDILALLAAIVFSLYTLLLRTVSDDYSPLLITKKTMGYGWVAIFLFTLLRGEMNGVFSAEIIPFIPHFLFLGIFASGLCFVSWTFALKRLGPVRTSQFIYLVPVITVTLSTVILGERFSMTHAAGMVCMLISVIISQSGVKEPVQQAGGQSIVEELE